MVRSDPSKLSLSPQQIKNAIKLVDKGLVQKIDDTTWIVQGSKGDFYQIELTEIKNEKVYTCWKNPKEKKLCQGWQFCKGTIKECKHVEAVREFERREK